MINSDKINPKLIEKIINVAYGDASFFERMTMYLKASRNDEVRKVLEEYKVTANSVQRIRKEELPEYVIESVRRRIEFENENESLISKIYFALFTKPIFSAAVVGIFVLAIISMFLFRQPTETPKYSKAEIELAQRQLGKSIAIVNKVFQKAEHRLENDVLLNNVDKHLSKGLNIIKDILIGG